MRADNGRDGKERNQRKDEGAGKERGNGGWVKRKAEGKNKIKRD